MIDYPLDPALELSLVTWERVRQLRADLGYQEVDEWLSRENLDAPLCDSLQHFGRKFHTLIMWRGVWIAELHQWNPNYAAVRIADSLSLRCLIRIPQIARPTPTGTALHNFATKFQTQIKNHLRLCASVWATTFKNNQTRYISNPPRWVQMLDQWAQFTQASPELPLFLARGPRLRSSPA